MYALHHLPQYYPDPHRFDPERFSAEEKAKRPPMTFLPFGGGPRVCGTRFDHDDHDDYYDYYLSISVLFLHDDDGDGCY